MKSTIYFQGIFKSTALLALWTLLLTALPLSKAAAQVGDIVVLGGDQTMNITTSVIGSEPTAVVNVSSTLQYWREKKVSKITVATTCPGQRFNLAVVATGVTQGVAAPQANLMDGMLALDLITDIPSAKTWTSATSTLRYTASATFAQGNSAELGSDVHTVTYTILGQ